MGIRFHWMLPKGGETADREVARVLTTSDASLAGRPDMENWTHFARQAEESGIESVLLSFGNYEPDTLQVACALGLATEKLKCIVAYRLGLMQPSIFVQQVNTLSHLVNGRIALNIVAGSSPAEQRGYGDFLGHDERYARADEFLAICHSLWRNDGEFDFNGKYCRVKGAKLHTTFFAPDRSSPEIYIAGHSEGAERLALKRGSCWLRLIDTPDKLGPLAARAKAAGVEMCLRLSLVCRQTREQAIQAAESLKSDKDTERNVRQHIGDSDSSHLKESLSSADKAEWLSEHLWAGLVPSYGPSAIALVGTPADLAQCFLEYSRIGITQFIISGWPKLKELTIFGREVMPLIRKAE